MGENTAVSEVELMAAAAKGDHIALAAMTLRCLEKPRFGIPSDEALCFAEIFGRIAAHHGKPDDQFMLAGILYLRANDTCERGDEQRAHSYLAEVVDLLDSVPEPVLGDGLRFLVDVLTMWANDGDDWAGVCLNRLTEGLSPAVAAGLCRDRTAAVNA